MRPLLPAIALALLLASGLSACTGDSDPDVDPSPTASASPSPSPTPDPSPTVEPEPESARAFIRRWQKSSFDMQNTGDPAEYLALASSCSSCEALAQGVVEIYERGGSVRDAGGSVSSIDRVGKVKGVQIYEFVLTTRPSSVIGADGEVEMALTGGSARYQVNLDQRSGNWLVTRVSRLEP